jgi:hypothetical protein
MKSKTLVILKNDFGWNFLVCDLPKDHVATRPGDLRADVILASFPGGSGEVPIHC